jgi:hypothetical protein
MLTFLSAWIGKRRAVGEGASAVTFFTSGRFVEPAVGSRLAIAPRSTAMMTLPCAALAAGSGARSPVAGRPRVDRLVRRRRRVDGCGVRPCAAVDDFDIQTRRRLHTNRQAPPVSSHEGPIGGEPGERRGERIVEATRIDRRPRVRRCGVARRCIDAVDRR